MANPKAIKDPTQSTYQSPETVKETVLVQYATVTQLTQRSHYRIRSRQGSYSGTNTNYQGDIKCLQ